uniref:GPN-loop GTPase 3 n=1 Tax=Ascaris lumbricoides TaxID=6252 RepID=A0A0M3IW22_ASCLU
MEYLVQNLDWLHEQLNEGEDDYFIFDCPGQIELYSHLPIMRHIVDALKQWDFNVCATFLLDTHFVLDADKFLGGALTSLSTMTALEVPSVNVLSKVDLLSERNRALLESFLEADTRSILQGEEVTPWNQKYRKLGEAIATVLDDYSLVPSVNVLSKVDLLSERNRALLESFLEADTRSILQGEEVTPWNQKYRKLGEAIATVLDDYSLVKFMPLNIEDEESIENLLLVIDNTIQYGEDLEVKDRYPEEMDDMGPDVPLE